MIRYLARRTASAAAVDGGGRRPWRRVGAAITTMEQPRRGYCLGVMLDGVDRSSEAFARNSEAMAATMSQLHAHIDRVRVSLIFFSMFVCYLEPSSVRRVWFAVGVRLTPNGIRFFAGAARRRWGGARAGTSCFRESGFVGCSTPDRRFLNSPRFCSPCRSCSLSGCPSCSNVVNFVIFLITPWHEKIYA